jgi:hypothetical protein
MIGETSLTTPYGVGHLARLAKRGPPRGRDGMLVSDTRNLASGVRKVEFKLSHMRILLPDRQ